MTEPNRRRWFRFSLRGMFVLVTLVCVWLGWNLNTVRERRAVRKEFEARNGFSFQTANDYFAGRVLGPDEHLASVSFSRRLCGDQAIQVIWYPWFEGPNETDLARLGRAFPEAQLTETPPEPCHPGCFPAGTLVATPDGMRLIETILTGDLVNSLDQNGVIHEIAVQQVFVTGNRLWNITTDHGALVTTETQPLCLADGTTRQAGKLNPGDTILQWQEQVARPVKVVSVTNTHIKDNVYNLILGDSEIFIAGGYLARSKPPAAVAKR